jgi:hypothetical protein
VRPDTCPLNNRWQGGIDVSSCQAATFLRGKVVNVCESLFYHLVMIHSFAVFFRMGTVAPSHIRVCAIEGQKHLAALAKACSLEGQTLSNQLNT